MARGQICSSTLPLVTVESVSRPTFPSANVTIVLECCVVVRLEMLPVVAKLACHLAAQGAAPLAGVDAARIRHQKFLKI